VFIPILERFSKDLESVLTRRQDHQDLGKLNAKALTSLKQKWLKIDNSTTSMNWVKTVRLKVNENPLSNYLQLAETETDSPHTKALLDSIEKLLLPGCTIPKRFCLSNLSLTDSQLKNWNLLKNLSKLIEWYTSFNNNNKNDLKDKASLILNSIKSLDLSRNQLSSFPIWLPLNLFPRLTSLSLSHNQFKVLPPCITLFSGLKRLKTNGNHRLITTSPDKALLRANSKRILQLLSSSTNAASASSESRRPSSLFRISIESLLVSTTTTTSTRLNSLLPPHLGEILTKSYTCQGCQNVIIYSSDRDNKYLEGGGLITERIHFVNPGINLPNPKTTTAIPREEEDSELQVASFEQLLLLMVYNRFDSQPPSSSSPSSSRSRKPGLPTLIIGGPDWKFCKDCAKLHLGGGQRDDDDAGGRKCGCYVCREERRVRGGEREGEFEQDRGEERVLRWLRRKERVNTKERETAQE
jgi:hypothetical protein